MWLRSIKINRFCSALIARNQHQKTSENSQIQPSSDHSNFGKQTSIGTSRATLEQKKQYMSYFSEVVDTLVNEKLPDDVKIFREPFRKILEYNIEKDWEIRGTMVVDSYKILKGEEKLTDEGLRLACIMGLCTELLQDSFIIVDDLFDNSEFRRGVRCWYKCTESPIDAVNHSLMICSGIDYILKKYFSTNRFYTAMLETFHHITFITYTGQSLEGMSMQNGKPRLDLYTVDFATITAIYKASYCTYYLSVITASLLAGTYNQRFDKYAEKISSQLGALLQVRDDLLDCFADAAVFGRKGNDIASGRCTWLVGMALEKGSQAQKEIIERYYGQPGLEAEIAVRNVYKEMDLVKRYYEHEKATIEDINKQIADLPDERERKVLSNLWNM